MEAAPPLACAAKPRRRWLQFSLRSLLLLTLAVALWLGYEVWQARSVERISAAIHALGGQVQCESTGWSLLAVVNPSEYGQRIVHVEIPHGGADVATELLSRLRDLREVAILFDGMCDPHPVWNRVHAALPGVRTTAKATPTETVPNLTPATYNRLQGLKARLMAMLPGSPAFRGQRVPKDWRSWEILWEEADEPPPTFPWHRAEYHVLRLSDGTIRELFALSCDPVGIYSGGLEVVTIAILIRQNRAVAWTKIGMRMANGQYRLVVDDIDHDGFSDVGFQCESSAHGSQAPALQFAGDARYWLALYRIDGDRFQSLLPRAQPSDGEAATLWLRIGGE